MQVLTLHWVVSDTKPVQRGRNFSLLLSGLEVQPPQVVPTDTSEEGRGLRKRGSLLSHEESLGSPLSCLRLPQQGSCMPSSSRTRVESVLSQWPLLVGLTVGSTGFFLSCLMRVEKSLSASVLACWMTPFQILWLKKSRFFMRLIPPSFFFFGPCPLAFWVTSFSSSSRGHVSQTSRQTKKPGNASLYRSSVMRFLACSFVHLLLSTFQFPFVCFRYSSQGSWLYLVGGIG